jgi:hypothetical protein
MTTTGTPTQRRSTVPTLNWTLSTNKKKPRLGSRGIREKLLTLYSLLPCNRVSDALRSITTAKHWRAGWALL